VESLLLDFEEAKREVARQSAAAAADSRPTSDLKPQLVKLQRQMVSATSTLNRIIAQTEAPSTTTISRTAAASKERAQSQSMGGPSAPTEASVSELSSPPQRVSGLRDDSAREFPRPPPPPPELELLSPKAKGSTA
jgi:hypothetical protein